MAETGKINAMTTADATSVLNRLDRCNENTLPFAEMGRNYNHGALYPIWFDTKSDAELRLYAGSLAHLTILSPRCRLVCLANRSATHLAVDGLR